MSLYPETVKRCQHIKVNGTQCGSPALRDSRHCYYHIRYHLPELEALPDNKEFHLSLPTLEDANSIQVALAKVMERLILQEVDHKTAALLLYALQTASMNLQRTSLEPRLPTHVVIDRSSVANRPIGASAWSRIEGREYDDLNDTDAANPNQPAQSLVPAKKLPPAAAPASRPQSRGRSALVPARSNGTGESENHRRHRAGRTPAAVRISV